MIEAIFKDSRNRCFIKIQQRFTLPEQIGVAIICDGDVDEAYYSRLTFLPLILLITAPGDLLCVAISGCRTDYPFDDGVDYVGSLVSACCA